jgi:serine/threonine protein kinase
MLREEANIMEKLVHDHIVKLVGTYVYKRKLYILLWPVAVCNLGDFLADLDWLRAGDGDREDIISRLHALDLKDLSAIDAPCSSLKASVDRPGCPLQYLRQTMGCIAQAIEYCHDAEVRHLDLKPSNILLSPGRVYLADFGISKDVQDRDNTMTRGMPGTAKWRAPELRQRDRDWSMRAADVYSLGLVFLTIATVVHHAPLHGCDQMLNQVSTDPDDFDKLHEYLHKLELLALATQEVDDVDAPTFGPRHAVHLIARMVSQNPSSRPVISQVNNELAELGGVDQVYHSSCCRKSSRWVIDRMNTRLKVVAYERDRLRAEHGEMARQLQVLAAKDETYESRLVNERKVHADNISKLQAQLDKERNERKRLEGLVAEMEHHPNRRQPRAGIPRPASCQQPVSGTPSPAASPAGLTMRARPPTRPVAAAASVQQPPASQPPQPSLAPSLGHSPRPTYCQAAASIAPRTVALVAAPARRESLIPSPSPAPIPHNSSSPDLTGYTLRSRGSGSKLPRAINPTTPIRSGTPNLNRDPESTDSTQYSMSDSVFSRLSLSKASLAGTSVAGTPPTARSPAVVMDMRRAPSPVTAKAEPPEDQPASPEATSSGHEKGIEHGLGLGLTDPDRDHERERDRRESIASTTTSSRMGGEGASAASMRDTASIASSAAIGAGTLSPVLSGSAVSSPRLVHASVEGVRGANGVPVPGLPTAKSWADVARRQKRG